MGQCGCTGSRHHVDLPDEYVPNVEWNLDVRTLCLWYSCFIGCAGENETSNCACSSVDSRQDFGDRGVLDLWTHQCKPGGQKCLHDFPHQKKSCQGQREVAVCGKKSSGIKGCSEEFAGLGDPDSISASTQGASGPQINHINKGTASWREPRGSLSKWQEPRGGFPRVVQPSGAVCHSGPIHDEAVYTGEFAPKPMSVHETRSGSPYVGRGSGARLLSATW